MVGRDDAFVEDAPRSTHNAPRSTHNAPRPSWSADAETRLAKVPGFVRGMVKKIYTDYARERAIAEVTPEVMDRARTELGLEGM